MCVAINLSIKTGAGTPCFGPNVPSVLATTAEQNLMFLRKPSRSYLVLVVLKSFFFTRVDSRSKLC